MSTNRLFKNININTYVPWRNQTKETVSVTIFDEKGLFLQESKIHPESYIFLPSNFYLEVKQEILKLSIKSKNAGK